MTNAVIDCPHVDSAGSRGRSPQGQSLVPPGYRRLGGGWTLRHLASSSSRRCRRSPPGLPGVSRPGCAAPGRAGRLDYDRQRRRRAGKAAAMPQRILFLGGTGVISAACVRLAVHRGDEVTVLNRGSTVIRDLPDQVETLTADLRDSDAVDAALGDRRFDAVAQFMAFTPDQVEVDIKRFAGRTRQYVFVSSASAYQKPPATATRHGVDAPEESVLAVLAGKDRVRGPARSRLSGGRLPDDRGAPLAHLRRHEASHHRRVDGHRPDARGAACGRSRRRHHSLDAHAQRRLRCRLRRAGRASRGHRERVHDHRRLRPDVEPGVRVAGRRRRRRPAAARTRRRPRRSPRRCPSSGRGSSATRRTP